MDYEEFVKKTDAIREQSKETTDVEVKKRLRNEFFDVAVDYHKTFTEAIDYYRENLHEDFKNGDGSVTLVEEIEQGPRTENTPYNETPTTNGNPMSEKTSTTPETPKTTNRFAAKLNSLKPSNQSDEVRETIRQRIKLTASFAAGVLLTTATVAVVSYYKAIAETPDVEDTEEGEETTED